MLRLSLCFLIWKQAIHTFNDYHCRAAHGWMFGGLFLLPAISSMFMGKKRKQLIKQQSSIETLRYNSLSDFEVLVGVAFRRKGGTRKHGGCC
jgi:hypothetical protein